mmetsp:Transcript_21304/g.50787  ORF Transcript_21304/g.50787 Transcript_21304/m.50787 type:complete len:220 (-) Transcript_21304:159-818(-)
MSWRCACIAFIAASIAPTSAAACRPAMETALVRWSSAEQPIICTDATCGCACIASTTAATPCLCKGSENSPTPFARPLSRLQATSTTRATVTCSLSAAVASAIPITSMFASLGGGASCGAGPIRCRRRRPPSSSSSLSVLTRPASGCLAATCCCNNAAAAAVQVVGRCWQARRCSAIAPRVVVWSQWTQTAGRAATCFSWARLRFRSGIGSRHSGQRRG